MLSGFRFIRAAGLLGGLLLAGLAHGQPLVERVSAGRPPGGSGYVVRLHLSDRPGAWSDPKLRPDGLIELVLYRATLSPALRREPAEGPVLGYEITEEKKNVVLRVRAEPGRSFDLSAHRDRDSNDLLLVLDGAPPVALAGTERAADGERWKLDRIVIDAGHGGKDIGATANGIREKDVTLGVALKLGALIERELKIPVVYTRRDDRFIELRERGQLANRAGGKLFISIHANSVDGERRATAAGTETYFLGLHKSDEAGRVMERENSVISLESDPDAYRSFSEEALILRTLAQSSYLRESEELAARIERRFSEGAGLKSRGVKQAGFLVLWAASMPSILVELGFVTNPKEAALMASERGQASLANDLFQAIKAYKTHYEQGLDLAGAGSRGPEIGGR